jgi:polyphosphate glucokinase
VAVLGIDVGGSGIKGAPVDSRRGVLLAERFRLQTPKPAKPGPCLDQICEVVQHFDWSGAVGLTFPGVVSQGVVRTAVNLSKSWVGVNIVDLVGERLGRPVVVLNDADAAGVAEVAYGAAKGVSGLVLLLTFGTGVGSGMFLDGRLIPNSELGHLELGGRDAESQIAESVREATGLSWKKWAKRTNDYLAMVEGLFSPDLIVIGGGIDKSSADWLHLLQTQAPLKVAALGNQAGIVGAAMIAYRDAARIRRTTSSGASSTQP